MRQLQGVWGMYKASTMFEKHYITFIDGTRGCDKAATRGVRNV